MRDEGAINACGMSEPWSPPHVRVELRRDAGRVTAGRSPWIRRDEIARVLGAPDPRALAIVHDAKGHVIATGTYSPESAIVVRVLSWGASPLADGWMNTRIAASLRARALLGLGGRREADATTGYREINSEGDGLPGLTVDRYGDTRVVALGTAPMVAWRAEILATLASLDPVASTLVLQPDAAGKREGFAASFSREPALADGEPPPLSWHEHGLRFTAPAPPAQKTGAYHDQRENRRLVATRAAAAFAATGVGLLDLGCHVGGFAIAAARLGVPVVAVDRSTIALDFVRRNAASNDVSARVTTVEAEMFGALRSLEDTEATSVSPTAPDLLAGPFSCIVFDPPKLAANTRDRERAVGAMEAVIVRLVPRLVPGGLLVVCSCSAAIGSDELAVLAVRSATRTGRRITRTFESGAGDDHPVSPGHHEGHYLTVVGWRVD